MKTKSFPFLFWGEMAMLTMQRKMTEEQQKMVEDNINLARYMTNKWLKGGVRNFDYDEIFSMFSFALCKAARTFDPNKGAKFATYAGRCMENEIKMAFRKMGRIGRENSRMNFEDPIHIDTEGNPLTLMDIYSNDDHLKYNEILDIMCAKDALGMLKDREIQIIISRYFHMKSQKIIADELKISQSYISRLEKKIIKKLKDFSEKPDRQEVS
jgi:RNA polymerase sporulation-specific sigma factor